MSDIEQAELEDRGDTVVEAAPDAPESTPATQEGIDSASPAKAPETTTEREIHIPKERFDEVNSRWREDRQALLEERQVRLAVEERLRALEMPKAPPFDLKATSRAYHDALAEGDSAKASDLWAAMTEYQRNQQRAQLNDALKAEVERARTQIQVEAVADVLVEKYPFLDPNSVEANTDAIKEVVEFRDFYIHAKKMAPAKALREAVARVVPNYTKSTAQSGIAAGMDRTQAQRLANAKAAAALPPSTAQAGVGERSARAEKVDVAKMSDKEFSSLSDEDRAKLRGDVLVHGNER